MFFRIIVGLGTFAAGYYLGREVGRHEPVRRELEEGRASGRYREIHGGSTGGDEASRQAAADTAEKRTGGAP